MAIVFCSNIKCQNRLNAIFYSNKIRRNEKNLNGEMQVNRVLGKCINFKREILVLLAGRRSNDLADWFEGRSRFIGKMPCI